MPKPGILERDDSRIIIHFDYDCFYASVVEHENPILKTLPLAIQQKQIIVTCNYEARRRGLHKLQLIAEAKKICPDVIIVLGEDIVRFRDASKELYAFLREKIWSNQAERLGFDEVWLDCTDMIEYNMELINHNDLSHSFFCMARSDPTVGFDYDASTFFGETYPSGCQHSAREGMARDEEELRVRRRLVLGSHLARHLRHELEIVKGYTATVGIATNKTLSKLVGNVNKPRNQTTMVPTNGNVFDTDSVMDFMDNHDIGKVPGIGFKLSQKIRQRVLNRPVSFDEGPIYGGTREKVTVHDVRKYPGMGPEMLEDILSGPGWQKGIGGKLWCLIHGVDDSGVNKAKRVPSQISQEDSYMKYLRTFDDVKKQLHVLAQRLITRMHVDLMDDEEQEEVDGEMEKAKLRRLWLAHPRTLRLSTRPRLPVEPDGTRARTSHRISRSGPLPNFVFKLSESASSLATRLVEETLVPMFRKLHPERTGWNLSLINIAVTNMVETAAENKDSSGRDIERMFKRQDDVLKDFRIVDRDDVVEEEEEATMPKIGDNPEVKDMVGLWSSGSDDTDFVSPTPDMTNEEMFECRHCHAMMPWFAAVAHGRFHDLSTSHGESHA